MFLLNQLFKFLKMLHSETSTRQLSSGFVLGMFMGFTPTFTLLQFFYLVLMLILRINMGAVFLSFGLFRLLSFALDPVFDSVGLRVLRWEALTDLFVTLYNSAVVPYTFFYNTIIMGALTLSLGLSIPLFIISGALIRRYRLVVVARFKASWVFRAWTTSKLYPLYVKYTEFTHG